MNHAVRPTANEPRTTRAADGMERRAFTVEEVEAMVAAGIVGEDERFELIGGEMVPMSPKGARHEMVKIELNRWFQVMAPKDVSVAPETTLRLDRLNFIEPDFCVFDRALDLTKLDGSRVRLAVEVAASSLAYDLGRKIGLYAAFGVPEVWVVDAATLVTRIHRRLGAEGYADVRDLGPAERLAPVRAPQLAVTLAELGLTPALETDRETAP
ncbi:Uma2 family endonuclease [Prosthecomicrobium hirschii]|uniref:Uma2 family endonuclease n=1 Tax=Prosthecodimorpha hirschii TaxID=665126 RepID=UPI00221EB467|nr:Uma2 family endonuclease [Prosthecomicrobium hirschii]MCW1843581.1 Uma2 family endonuclease [Prosthecomicrobium hirschii]